MAELEEGGYLCRAHASAGRVPSDGGFRLYVDHLPLRSAPHPLLRKELARRMATMRRELAEDIEWVAQLVAEVTKEAGVAIRPLGEGPTVQAISLVLLDPRRVLGVVIADNGVVEKRVLSLDTWTTREELQMLSNLLTRQLGGAPLQDAREVSRRVDGIADETLDERLCEQAKQAASQLFSTDERDVEVRIAGTENLLATRDFAEVGRVRSLLVTLEDRTRLAADFRRAFASGRTQVLIGSESETTAEGNLSIVASLYFRDERRAGAVGVVGPRRMDYQRIVPVVEFVGDSLTRMLETSGAIDG
jgi:heat-inducible transcriptional repressor